jgi:NADH-quinone oxidoreductase subunit H
MRVGWHGLLQPIADALKVMMKEDIIPTNADRLVFILAPVLIFVPALASYLVVPFAPGIVLRDLNIGILYIFAITTLTVLSILMAGWASNNKWSLLGAFRSAAQIVSYEIPLVLSVLGVVMMTGSLSMVRIVEAQRSVWFILLQPVGFFIYMVAATAEVNRTPFDIPEAESELVSGYNVEYSGIKFAMFFLAEYANLFLVSAIATTLFLGGWQGPILPGFVWFLVKTIAIVFVLMWFRWTFPRFRVDQLMSVGWKILVPLAFVNILVTGLVMLAFQVSG